MNLRLFSSPRRSPFHRTHPPGLCWVCDRHIGPALTCPYCEAAQPQRSARITGRLIALSVAGAGLAALLASARLRPPAPLTPIAQINPQSLFANVRIEGRITRNPNPTNAFPIIRLRDDSGTIGARLDHAVGPSPPRDLHAGQTLAILAAVTLDSQGRMILQGLKWSIPSPVNPP